jgi:NAD(P)-dependent dehydrogenase (short-subunit alcohol dehydrogenase family)
MQQVLDSFTDRVALGRLGKPQEIARMIAVLAGDDASYLTGTTVLVDGGYLHNATSLKLRRAMNPEQF